MTESGKRQDNLRVLVICALRKQEEKGLVTHDPDGRVSVTLAMGASKGSLLLMLRGMVCFSCRGFPLSSNLYYKCPFIWNPRGSMTSG